MDWKMTAGGLTPPEVLVSDDLINQSDDQIDEALPEAYKEVGTIIYTADFSCVKCKNFDGSWKVSNTGGGGPTPSGKGYLALNEGDDTKRVKWEGTEEELSTHEMLKYVYDDEDEAGWDPMYKVSDLYISIEELNGGRYFIHSDDGDMEFNPISLDPEECYRSEDGECKAYWIGECIVVKEAGTFGAPGDAVVATSAGVYLSPWVSKLEMNTPEKKYSYIEADGKDVTSNVAQTLKPAIKVEDALKITWDGNTQGLSHTNVIHVEDEGFYVSAYKVADIPSDFAIEKLVPFHTVVINFNGEEQVGVDITDIEQLSEIEINDDFIILDDVSIIMLNPGTYPLGFGDMTFESAGFYFLGVSMEYPPESLLTYGSKFISDAKKVSINPLLQSVSFEIYQTNRGEEEDPEWKARYNGATLSNEEAYNIASYCFEHFIPFNTYVKNQWGKTRQCGTFTYVSNGDEQSITASVNAADYQLVIYPEEIYFSER